MEQRFDHRLVTDSSFFGKLPGAFDIRNRQAEGNVPGGYRAPAAMFQQQIRNQILMAIPPARFLGLRGEYGRIHNNRPGLFRVHRIPLTFLCAVCAVTTRILLPRIV